MLPGSRGPWARVSITSNRGTPMKPAPIRADESDRLSELKALNILDTPREPRFDRITGLVADVFGVPMVFLTLVDGDRQWFSPLTGSTLKPPPAMSASARTPCSNPRKWWFRCHQGFEVCGQPVRHRRVSSALLRRRPPPRPEGQGDWRAVSG
jgi:hypothetical protein